AEFKTRYVRPVSAQAVGGPIRRNIVGCAVGEKIAENGPTGDQALVVFVRTKLGADDVPAEMLIPKKFDNYVTDVVPVGDIKPHAVFAKAEGPPAYCGSSISPRGAATGTAGCLVVLQNGKLCILSNNHVLAQVNAGIRRSTV